MLLAPALSAQGSFPELRAHTNVGTFAGDGQSTVLQSAKAGTVIKDRLELSASISRTLNAISQIQITTGGNVVAVTMIDVGVATSSSPQGRAAVGTTQSTDPKHVVQGPHSFLLRIPATQGACGKVFVRYSGLADGNGRGIASIDVGNDGKVEFHQRAGKEVNREFASTAGAHGVEILITSDGAASVEGVGKSSYRTSLVLRYMPLPGCTFRSYGGTCGAVLTARTIPTPGGPILFLELKNAPKSSPVGLVFGTRAVREKLPGTDCLLLANIVAWEPFHTNEQGEIRQVFGGPATAFFFYAQDLILDRSTSRILASNGLRGDCR